MENKKPLLPVKSDFVFRQIFGDQRNEDILGAFLRSVLDIPDDEYDHLIIVDPHLKKESEDDKYAILDVKLHTVNGSIIHVEIQRRVHADLRLRTIFSQSRLITEQMASGNKWSKIKRAITIIITDEIFMRKGNSYHNQFRYRTKDGLEFTDFTEINTLDLSKLPLNDDSTNLWYWMKFIKSDDEEGLDMLAMRSPEIKKAVGLLKEMSADESIRMLYEQREMVLRDIESMKDDALRENDEKWQGVVANVIADKDAEIAGKDAEIADMSAENKQLRDQIAALQTRYNS